MHHSPHRQLRQLAAASAGQVGNLQHFGRHVPWRQRATHGAADLFGQLRIQLLPGRQHDEQDDAFIPGPFLSNSQALQHFGHGLDGAIQLAWTTSASPDVVGYNVYAKAGGQSFAQAEVLRLGAVTDGIASEAEAVRREVAVGAIAGKRSKVHAEASKSVPQRFNDAGSMLAWFAGCSLCGDCLDACPLYDGELGGLLGVGGTRYGGQALFAELVDVSRWLASCSGCGMCEEACGSDVPLTLFISAVTHRIQEELYYAAGDPSQPLPWAPG